MLDSVMSPRSLYYLSFIACLSMAIFTKVPTFWTWQELATEARFWGAFGVYSFITLVCDVFSIMFKYSDLPSILWSLVDLWNSDLLRLEYLIDHLKAGISCIRIEWRFYDISADTLHAACMDILPRIFQGFWLHLSQVIWNISSTMVLYTLYDEKALDYYLSKLKEIPSRSCFFSIALQ